MAQKVQITLVDDIDGGPATETVSFSLDGVAYEIDLSESNASRLREAFAPFVGTARRLGGRSGASGGAGGRRGRPRGGNNRIAEIRAWARENGHKVNERGRIPADITAAFEKAHG